MAASTARAFFLSRISDFSPITKPQPFSPSAFSRRYSPVSSTVSCLSSSSSSSSSGGGVSDDTVSTRKSSFDRGFCVIANMLKKIEPLDTCVISKGVSDSAKDSMKQTISTMLGLLPSDQFSVSIRLSKHPLDRLLVSSIMTGYTLWNAEYRISLMRNFDISVENSKELDSLEKDEELSEDREGGVGEVCIQDLQISPQIFGDLSPEALNYIQQLQLELSDAEQELDARKQETMRIECNKGSRNDLLEYLRSLDSEMVSELSRPSSVEVEDIVHQLVQNVVRKFFKDDPTSRFMGCSAISNTENHKDGADEFCDSMGTSRDYLAKLLFWCMLLGHHLRGLENRLHLTCVVGLL
ncbi:hypothetical protein RCOM_0852780 [Ricinus communis]|uniref:Uncharacterized protein n=1 Tax=Ricinus communis TaxID=3988 RepID=B9RUH5_RICCO|nr:hypothetical protein RCOM_0852780 [Ricinus communis]|eukprot:XP_002517420.1 uncharacterized protein LOC8280602 [Ricinus communis]